MTQRADLQHQHYQPNITKQSDQQSTRLQRYPIVEPFVQPTEVNQNKSDLTISWDVGCLFLQLRYLFVKFLRIVDSRGSRGSSLPDALTNCLIFKHHCQRSSKIFKLMSLMSNDAEMAVLGFKQILIFGLWQSLGLKCMLFRRDVSRIEICDGKT